MRIKRSDILDYLIVYWMIAHIFIISWFAYLTQSALVMICLILVRLLVDFKRTMHLSSFYFGIIFSLVYPIWNYMYLGGKTTILALNLIAVFTSTVMLIYMSFICKYKRLFIIDFFKKNKYLFNLYMIINIPILTLQLVGFTTLSGRHPESLNNTFQADLVSGLFGYNGTGLLTMYFCFLILYNVVQYKCRYIKQKQEFVVYNFFLLGIMFFIAANSDNKALFVLMPLFLIAFLVIFRVSFYKNFFQKARALFRYIVKGMSLFSIFIICLQPILGTLDHFKDIVNKLQTGWMKGNVAHGSAERLGMIAYALKNSNIRWSGIGIAKHAWQESKVLGFAHFGISDSGSFLCLGGILFFLLLACFLLSIYRNVFRDKITGNVFFILTIAVLIYTQMMTVMSLTCSWIFMVFTAVMGFESIEKRLTR